MSDNEKLKLGMYESVLSFLLENRDITSTIRGFNSSVTKLRKIIDEIKRTEKELSSAILEKTIISSTAKEDLIVSLIPISYALFNFARESGDIQLKEKTRMSHSSFERMRDSQLLDKAGMLYMLSMLNLAKLKKFGITSEVLESVDLKVDLFRRSLDEKINTFISSGAAMTMTRLIEQADSLLMKQMDSYVENLSDEFIEFYDEYLMVRSLEYQDLKNELQESEEEDVETA